MKKRIIALFMLIALMVGVLPVSVKADNGPKPTTTIRFTGFGDEECYGTILCSHPASTMWQAFTGDTDDLTEIPERAKNDCDCSFDVWKAFVNYKDAHSYYFLQRVWKVSDASEIYWGYMAPSKFKVLLYFPATNTFVTSGVIEKASFNSFYQIDKAGVLRVLNEDGSWNEQGFEMEAQYDFFDIIIGVLSRLITTLVIEMLLALVFKFRSKYQLLVILAVNIATQAGLNLVLAIREFKNGQGWDYYGIYIMLEILILIIEAVAYVCLLNKKSENKRRKSVIVAYTFAANLLSFLAGTVTIML